MKQCKCCGIAHVWSKKNCPAFGKLVHYAKKNYSAKMCSTKKSLETLHKRTDLKKSKVNCVGYDEETEWIIKSNDSHVNRKQIKCRMLVNNVMVPFQTDTGNTVDILPREIFI